ncbi:MAG TPA: CHRD domain-containing protein [Candidatus Binatia bacterium]|jgi:hypothetical protein|nr:CHRD domain-containing protein [Candidatus Binatia bacterium]
MKKTLLAITLLASLATIPARAAQFWYDVVTNYSLGGITTNTANWFAHQPGSLTAHDTLVVSNFYTSGATFSNGRHLRINGLNTEYVMHILPNSNVLASGFIYASFIANASFVPSGGNGTYFAAFNDLGIASVPDGWNLQTNGFNFRGRVYEIGNTNVFPFTNTTAGTFRYGVSAAAGDPAQGGGASIRYVPIDLLKNMDVQVVLKYDISTGLATLWINPASESDTANMAISSDVTGFTTLAGLIFRQRTGGGTVDVRDVVVGDTFADVMTNTTANPVLIATNYSTVTNYSGNPALLEVFPTCLGGGPLNYQWYQIVSGVTNVVAGATSQTYYIASLSASDQGNYFCAVTNSGGAVGAVSRSDYYISVNSTPTPPGFTAQPKSGSASVGGTLTLSCTAFGTGPLSYQWFFSNSIVGNLTLVNGSPVTTQPGDASVVNGSQSPTLVVTGVSTNETGAYYVTVNGGLAPSVTSTNAQITVLPPQTRTIAFLRGLLNTNTWTPTDTTTTFNITGVVTTVTNLTSGTTSSYYVQDSTAGINLFITGDAGFRPTRGDVVTANGTLSSFNNSLELACNALNPYQTYSILSHSNTLPAPSVFSFTFTNNAGAMETNYEGRYVMLTNIFFPPGNFPNGTTVTVSNQNGASFLIFVSSQCAAVVGQPMPPFAWGVIDALTQSKSGAYSSTGYELNLTDLSDLITTAPSEVTVNIAKSGTNVVLSWTAVPYNYSYTVYCSTSLLGPWVPLASGLTFTTEAGSFTDSGKAIYGGTLSGSQEVPSSGSTGSGSGFVVLSPDKSTLTVNMSFSGISAPATAAHIHGPAAAGVNASVLFPFTGVPGATSGSIPQQSFAITPTQVGYLQSGLLYFNVHDANFPAGEIRAQILPVSTTFYKIASP